MKIKTPTQAELIARALDMEEGNTIEHREYLSIEEEKRKKARVVRKNVEGPLLRWISKVEHIKVEIPPPPPPPSIPPASNGHAVKQATKQEENTPATGNASGSSGLAGGLAQALMARQRMMQQGGSTDDDW